METMLGRVLMGLVACFGALAAGAAAHRFFTPRREEDTSSIISIAGPQKKELSVFDRLHPDKGMMDRVDLFLARPLGLEKSLESRHMLLGRPEKLNPLKMLHYKEAGAVVLPIALFILLDSPLALLTAPIGFFLPDLFFKFRIEKRQEEILRNFPTFVDLSALIIESGLDYMTAFDRIVSIAPRKTELEIEIERTLKEVQLGYTRRDALRRLAMRTGLQELRSFVGLIIQSDELGTSLVDLLRNYAADMRFRRMNRAEKLAAQASTKMLFPLIFFIFPTVFILIMAPMIGGLLKGGGLPF